MASPGAREDIRSCNLREKYAFGNEKKRKIWNKKAERGKRKVRLKLKGQIIYKKSKNKSKEYAPGCKNVHIAGLEKK
jgi:hypothetical protein